MGSTDPRPTKAKAKAKAPDDGTPATARRVEVAAAGSKAKAKAPAKAKAEAPSNGAPADPKPTSIPVHLGPQTVLILDALAAQHEHQTGRKIGRGALIQAAILRAAMDKLPLDTVDAILGE